LGKGIQVCSIKEQGPLQRGDIRKNGVGHLKILFLRTMKPERLNMGARGLNGANGNGILYYISIKAKVTQVSDVAHGPLV
jgi:hypothetical protein